MKNAMIWGAGGGIGHALSKQLMQSEWNVIGISRDSEKIESDVSHAITADVTNEFDVQNAVMSAGYEVDDIQLWIYAVGDIISQKSDALSSTDWQRIIGANLTGAFQTVHHSLPLMADDAHIVFLGAVSERLRLPGLSAYVAAKAGLESFAETLRKEQRKKRVTIVRPGAVATPFWDKVPLRLPKDAASPEKVAHRILEAHESGHSGVLDLL
ncbi:MAG: SDR family NAD(P)-dependent oxidoreductase [Chloroflexi bacterium]|nr:MAG: SDR family NAD(P)-dependent oxidoreductase [Chloroflexota bacterium]